MSLLWFIALLIAFAMVGGTCFLAGIVCERNWQRGGSSPDTE